ncbi:MAG: right-handed parallel beta-helix repeat-containing protein, partial [Gemmatimonadales bacterium]
EEPVTPFRHGRGVYISGIDTLRVLFSEFLGSPDLHSYEAIRVWNGADLVEILNTTATYWEYEAIDLYNVMQLDMRDSEVSFNRQEGVYMSVGGGGGNEYPTNARFYRNRLIDNRFEGLDINYAGLIELQHNFIETSYFEAIDIFGFFPIRPESKLTMLGDTIDSYVDDDYYIYIIRMDSILVDSLQFYNSGDYEDSRWDGNYVGITNSTFDGITGYTIDSDARDFVLDNSVFTGCSTCTRDADAVMVDPLSDSLLTVWITNNTFTNVFEALDVAWLGDSTGVFTVTGNTIDSAFTGMRLYSDSLVVQNNTLTGIDNYGIRTLSPEVVGRTRMTSGISNNSVTCSPGRSATGIRVDYQPAHIANNTVTDCFYGIHAFNRVSGLDTFDLMVADNTVISDQSPGLSVGIWQDGGNYRWSFLRNKVKFGDTGIRGAVAVENTVLIADSNVTQETTAVGFRISGTSATSSVVARWNNITNNLAVGLLHTATSPVAFNLGRFVGNGTFGVTAGIGASTIDATQNWWGAVGGSGAVGADTVTGAVNTGSPLASDPTTTVPPAFAPPGFAPNFAFRGTPADRELRPVAGPDNERPRRVREADDDDDSDRAARHAAADAEAQRIREARRQRQGDRPVRPPR